MAFEKLASYEATNWAKGDVITEAKLDKIEDQLTILTNYSKGMAVVTSSNDTSGIVPESEVGIASYNSDTYIPTTKYVNTSISATVDSLQVSPVNVGANKTLVSIEETKGKIVTSATAISVPIAQINDVQLVSGYNFTEGATNTITAANTIMTLDKFTSAVLTNTNTTTTKAVSSLSYSNGVLTGKLAPIAAATTQAKGVVQVGSDLKVNDGVISGNYTTDSNSKYNASTNALATIGTVSNAISSVSMSTVTIGAGKTLETISQSNGVINVSATAISISASQISNLNTLIGTTANSIFDINNDKIITSIVYDTTNHVYVATEKDFPTNFGPLFSIHGVTVGGTSADPIIEQQMTINTGSGLFVNTYSVTRTENDQPVIENGQPVMDDITLLEVGGNVEVETIEVTGNTAANPTVSPSITLGSGGTITIGNTTINEQQLIDLLELVTTT